MPTALERGEGAVNPFEALAKRVRQHQTGVLLDTNVLLLYLGRQIGSGYVAKWKRTSDVQAVIYGDLLDVVLKTAKRLVTTPHILAEASNLSSLEVMPSLRLFLMTTPELTREARHVAQDKAFLRLGMADCAMLALVSRTWRKPLVVTLDGPLTVEMETRKLPVANLNHYAYPTI